MKFSFSYGINAPLLSATKQLFNDLSSIDSWCLTDHAISIVYVYAVCRYIQNNQDFIKKAKKKTEKYRIQFTKIQSKNISIY